MFYLYIIMKTYEYEVYIANTLKFIHLLPINEQINELNAMLKRYRAINKKIDRKPEYNKLIKKIFWLPGKLPY